MYWLKYILSKKYVSYDRQEKWLKTLKERRDIPLSWFINFRRLRLNCPSRESPEKRGIILSGFEKPHHGKALTVDEVNLLASYASLPSKYMRSIRNQMRMGRSPEEIEISTKYA